MSTNDVIGCAGRYFLSPPTPTPFPSLLLPLCISHHRESLGVAGRRRTRGQRGRQRGKQLIKIFPKHLRHIPAFTTAGTSYVSWVWASLLEAQIQAGTESEKNKHYRASCFLVSAHASATQMVFTFFQESGWMLRCFAILSQHAVCVPLPVKDTKKEMYNRKRVFYIRYITFSYETFIVNLHASAGLFCRSRSDHMCACKLCLLSKSLTHFLTNCTFLYYFIIPLVRPVTSAREKRKNKLLNMWLTTVDQRAKKPFGK